MNALASLREQFQSQIELRERRPGIVQLVAPLFHEDGDMMDVFLDLPRGAELTPNQLIRISDYGKTLMRLSYSFDIDTPNKERIYHRVLAENGVREDESGALVLEAPAESLYPALLQFAQAIAKVSNLRLFKREMLASLFEEMLDAFVVERLGRFRPQEAVLPIPERDDLEVRWQLEPNGVPLFLFAVKDPASARLTTISCQAFQLEHLRFKSLVVHEDFDRLGRKDRVRITSAADKQFPSLEDFQKHAEGYLEREAPA